MKGERENGILEKLYPGVYVGGIQNTPLHTNGKEKNFFSNSKNINRAKLKIKQYHKT